MVEGARYFYPRPPRGGRHGGLLAKFDADAISIHALREEGDVGKKTFKVHNALFLSTPSARRATFHDL